MALYFPEVDGGPQESPIYFDDVQCRGTELTLEDCEPSRDTEDCIHDFQDAGVLCQP